MDKNLQSLADELISTMEEGMSRVEEDDLGTDFYHDCARDVGQEGMRRLCDADRVELIAYMATKMLPKLEASLKVNIEGLLIFNEEVIDDGT